MTAIRVLVVDDSVVVRRQLETILSAEKGIVVLSSASGGCKAMEAIQQQRPDIVILDIEMPCLNGLEVLKLIRRQTTYLPVIMYSSQTEHGASTTLEAMALGADDYALKPAGISDRQKIAEHVRSLLLPKIRMLARPSQREASKDDPQLAACRFGQSVDIVAIGASTGGPNAISQLLKEIPRPLPVPLLIVQHMPPIFTHMFAERLRAQTVHNVREAISGHLLHAGDVWIAPGDYHMDLMQRTAGIALHTHQGSAENCSRPAVDPLFRSIAKRYGSRVLTVMLTGMGRDGLVGCQSISQAGGQIVVQDQASSTVWGMPGVIAKAGLAEKILPLDELAEEMMRRIECGSLHRPADGGMTNRRQQELGT